MGRLKVFGKYLIWVIVFFIFASFIGFIALNASYKDIENKSELPSQIEVEYAKSNSVVGKIYGTVKNSSENNLNNKYIKVDIYTRYDNYAGSKYLKIENLGENETKKFEVNFKAEYIKYYTIELENNTEEVEIKVKEANELFKNIFTNEKIKNTLILLFLLRLII